MKIAAQEQGQPEPAQESRSVADTSRADRPLHRHAGGHQQQRVERRQQQLGSLDARRGGQPPLSARMTK